MSEYTAQQTANFFLQKAKESDAPLTHMQLQKLVYIGYGWVAACLDTKLFDAPIEAWKFGPVIGELFYEFQRFGKKPITTLASTYDPESEETTFPKLPYTDGKIQMVLTQVWLIYSGLSGWALSNKTHEKGTPWKKHYKEGEDHVVIPHTTIQPYFTECIKRYLAT